VESLDAHNTDSNLALMIVLDRLRLNKLMIIGLRKLNFPNLYLFHQTRLNTLRQVIQAITARARQVFLQVGFPG
jgi:hypothetical protein